MSGGGMVVTTQQLAADAGRDLLAAGGSAVDAVVAAAFALCVVDPSNCGLGGYGGFLLYASAGEEPVAVEFDTWMPSSLDPARLRPPGYLGPVTRGGLGVAPPAVVPGLLEAHARFGRRRRADVLEPAVRLARAGFHVGEYLAWALEQHLAQGGAGRDAEFDSLFYPGGKPIARGSLLVQPDLAGTLETISELGANALRSGPVAAAICEATAAADGVLTPDDLAQDRVVVGPPATTTFAGATLYVPSRDVSGAGVLIPALDEIDPEALGENRSHDYVAALADGLRRAWRMRLEEAGMPAGHPHTTHLAAAGPDGDLATLTFTHGPWFGSDLIAPGTGIVLNAGANILTPISGGRAVTNMCPTVLDAPGGARHALGAAGGPRIPALLLTTVVDVVHYEMALEQAVAAPHLAVRAAEGTLEVEAELRVAGRPVDGAATMSRFDFGPVCGITRVGDRCFAAPDRRFESGLAHAELSS